VERDPHELALEDRSVGERVIESEGSNRVSRFQSAMYGVAGSWAWSATIRRSVDHAELLAAK
jgi:hypothetical protein